MAAEEIEGILRGEGDSIVRLFSVGRKRSFLGPRLGDGKSCPEGDCSRQREDYCSGTSHTVAQCFLFPLLSIHYCVAFQ